MFINYCTTDPAAVARHQGPTAPVTVDAIAAVAAVARSSTCAARENMRNSEIEDSKQIEVSMAAQQGGERVSEREHKRVGRVKKGGYSETARRAPKRGREEQQRNGFHMGFQVVHIAPVKRRLMQRLEGLPRGDG